MEFIKKGKYLLGFLGLLVVLSAGEWMLAAPTVSSINGGPVKLIYDYIGHYELNYTGNTNNYDYWNDSGTSKLVSKTYKDRSDIASNNSSATISKADSKSKIVKAYLIWETRSEKGVTDPITLITPNNYGVQIPAQMACKDTRTNNAGQEYVGVYTMATDVTSIVCGPNGGYGTYTVANIPIWDGAGDGIACGGESVASWQLVVVEESPDFPLRTISLNLMSQYFYNVDYSIKVDFADASAPNGVVTATFLDGSVDVDTSYRYDGIGYEDDYNYEVDGIYFRYKTLTRGLYKNGVCINNRDTGSIYGGSNASGGIRVHLFDDSRRSNSVGGQTLTYRYAGTNQGVNVFLYGVAIDIFAYDVKFDGNGADEGSMEDMTCVYGRGYDLSKNTFTKQNYEFAGWNTKADGSGTSYKNEGYISNLTSTEQSVTLYAQWKPVGYNIILDSQDAATIGTSSYYEWYGMGNYTDSDCTTAISEITTPQKHGNTFGGYYAQENGKGTQYIKPDGTITSTSTTFTEETTLYAYWIPVVSKITLDNQGATSAGTTQFYQKFNVGNYTTSDCTTAISKITNPTKTHHTFQGYYTEKKGEGQQIIDASGNILKAYTLFVEDTTLYAYWEPNTYTITLDNQGATSTGTKYIYEIYGKTFYSNKSTTNTSLGTTTQTFNYTGAVQYFIAPADGTYTLETWGAQGYSFFSNGDGGKGGYAKGTIELKEGDILYIYVGGQGAESSGGWNGGGSGFTDSLVLSGTNFNNNSGTYKVGGGGGATDIRIGGTALSNRIIVGGGGGASGYSGALAAKIGNDSSSTLRGGYGGGVSSVASTFAQAGEFCGVSDYGSSNYQNGFNGYYSIKTVTDCYSPASQQNAGYVIKSTYYIGYLYGDRYHHFSVAQSGALGQGAGGAGGGYYGGSRLATHKNLVADVTRFSEVCVGYDFHAGQGGSSYVGGVQNGTIGTSNWRTGNGLAKITYNNYETKDIYSTQINIPTRTGYTFRGYYTGTNGSGTQIIDASGNILSTPTTFTKDTTLYAYWIASSSNTYQIAFHGNGATDGKMSIMTCSFSTNYTLNANAFTRTGYAFTGWNTKADGSGTSYADKATVNNLSTTKGDVVTLYAQWKVSNASYTVNHYLEELDGGWKLYDAQSNSGTTNSSVTPTSFKKTVTGFTYNHAEVKGATVTNATILADGSLVINLYYSRNSYSVTLNKETGIKEVTGAGTYKYEEKVTIGATVEKGYSWYNWVGTYISDSKTYRFTMPAENVTMTATTSPMVVKIYLDNQRAAEAGTTEYYQKYGIGNYAESECTTQLTTIKIPKKTGYEFSGYYTKADGLGTQYITEDGTIIASSTTFTEDTVLYAYWTPVTYIIRFEGNGSTGGSMSDFVCTYNELAQLPVNAFLKTHYAFNCWNTEADGSGTTYINGSFIENLTDVPNGVITLYAQWIPNRYTIHFDANGGEGYMDDLVFSYDIPQNLPLNTFTKNNGYGDSTFLGWNIISDTREVLYCNGAEVVNATEIDGSTLTLYAVWDDCPWIDADDLYYSLKDAQSGAITYDELISHATASDSEDGENILSGVDEEKGTSFTIIDYQPTDFTQFTSDGSVTETFKVIDSIGNSYKQTITVHIVDTEPKVVKAEGTTRFINEKYYYESFENGGLEDNSVWKTDPEYVNVIKQAFENSKNDTPIMSFHFEYEEILQMKEFIKENGIGNSVYDDALERFYVEFMEPNTVS